MSAGEHMHAPSWDEVDRVPDSPADAPWQAMAASAAASVPVETPGSIPDFLEAADQLPIGAHMAPASRGAHAAHDGEPRDTALDPELAAMDPLPPFVTTAAHGESAPGPEPAPTPAGEQPAVPGGCHDARASRSQHTEDSQPASPDTTAEIDVSAVEARLDDPGSTMSFAPLTEERINTDSTYDAGTSTSLMWGARSDVGCVRTHNEDSYLVQSPLFCVCDGMGGHAAGEVASSIAVETIARLAPQEADPASLAAAVEAANAAIIEAAANGLGKPGMGCTATAAYIQGNTIAIAHVGDSRAYLLHEGTLIRITHDHSYVEELVDAGEITADEARVHPNRSVITRALGSDPAMYADHFQLNIEEGDRLILCSDGLSSMISDGEIETVATQSPTAQICTDNLVDAALNAGGGDNVTVVVVDVVDDGRLRDLARRRRRNIFIALGGLVAAVIIALAITAFFISNSVFLGVKDGHVAIYTGVPGSFMGIELYQLSDETGIDINDLPEDTQNRLRAGIGQSDMEAARSTVSEYRQQIDAEQTRAAQDAAVIQGATSDSATDNASTEDAAASSTSTGTVAEGGER